MCSKCCRNFRRVLFDLKGLVLIISVLLSAVVHVSGSYSKLRKPRLDLTQNNKDENVVLSFYNLDNLSVKKMEDAVSCTVSGGHIEHTTDGWKQVTRVTLELNPYMEVWNVPKIMGGYESRKIQTRTTYNITYDVEGNLTCHDTLDLGLVSNTILIQQKNSASVMVNLRKNTTLPEMQLILNDYDYFSYSTQNARLIHMRNGTDSEVLLRVIYSNNLTMADDEKVLSDVRELTENIANKWNFSVIYVRSTRSCLSVDEGNFTWPITAAGLIVTPKNYCLDVHGIPVPKRKCIGDYFEGVHWDTVPSQPPVCHDPYGLSTRLRNITHLYNRKNLLEMLSNEITDETVLSPVEIYFISEALRQTAEEVSKPTSEISSIKTSTIVTVINAVLHSGSGVIEQADKSYGSSSTILESVQKLLQAAASPMPTPVSLLHFSAFASVAGTGIRGFQYSIIDGIGKMDTISKLDGALKFNAIAIAYHNQKDSKLSIISTFFKNGSLFSAANSEGKKSIGPIFGMKMFERGRESLEAQDPVLVAIRFRFGEEKPHNPQCVSWESSVEGGWSPAGCHGLQYSSKFAICMCTLLTSLDTYFSVIEAATNTSLASNHNRLTILPKKNNVGALLHFYMTLDSYKSEELMKKIVCSVKRDGVEDFISLNQTGNFSLSQRHSVIIFSLSYRGDGNVQCRIGDSLFSNECLLLIPNRAFLKFKAQNPMNTVEVIENYVTKHDLEFNFTKFSKDDSEIEIFLVSQYSKKSHLQFMKELKHTFEDLSVDNNFTLIEITSNRLCLKHEEGGFSWPNAKLQYHATPINPCIDKHGVPTPSRLCKGDHLNGMYWDKVPERPNPCIEPSKETQKLKELVTNTVKKDAFQDVLEFVEGGATVSIVELKLLAETLKNAAEEVSNSNSRFTKPNITSIVKMVDTIITAEYERPEQEETTVSSEDILNSIDTLLEKASTDVPEPVSTPRFSAIAAAPGSKYRGFVTRNDGSSRDTPIETISWNESTTEVLNTPVSTGAILLDGPEHVGVTYSVFSNNSLFDSDEDSDLLLDTPVVGFKMFDNDREDTFDVQNLTVLIFFYRDQSRSSKNRECYYWDKKARKWSNEGVIKVQSCNLPGEIPDGMDACMSTHLTHFAMLVSTVKYQEDDILTLLTLVGCSISLICLVGIFIMAILSPKWRQGASKKVQLNLSASLAMLMASYLAIETLGECPKSLAWCITLGAVVHYSVLAAFSWMLVVAVLQLLRLTPGVSMDSRRHTGTHLVLKTSIFGWGLPMIPVIATLAMGTDIYKRRENTALCYPSGRAFYIAVMFPVVLAITINTIVFIWLINILFCNKMKAMRVHQKSQAMRRFFSALFLFCLLGITWISGIFVEITVTSDKISKILTYIFCATATLQGTSLFIFFVACDRGVGNKVIGAMTSLTNRSSHFRSQNKYTNKFDSVSSEKTSTTMELSHSTKHRKNKS